MILTRVVHTTLTQILKLKELCHFVAKTHSKGKLGMRRLNAAMQQLLCSVQLAREQLRAVVWRVSRSPWPPQTLRVRLKSRVHNMLMFLRLLVRWLEHPTTSTRSCREPVQTTG
ncbi:MAG: hypothetical protein [Circular genetic element sp.]|nr:MAG: hypothetical protein [Circular genetic element sp.]